jgi:hypothetical protein
MRHLPERGAAGLQGMLRTPLNGLGTCATFRVSFYNSKMPNYEDRSADTIRRIYAEVTGKISDSRI